MIEPSAGLPPTEQPLGIAVITQWNEGQQVWYAWASTQIEHFGVEHIPLWNRDHDCEGPSPEPMPPTVLQCSFQAWTFTEVQHPEQGTAVRLAVEAELRAAHGL